MGMFDTIRVFGSPVLTCAAGHEIAELQTKDLECVMDAYLLHDGRLYRQGRCKRGTETTHVDESGRLVVTTRRLADPVALTSEVAAYSSCNECRPVLYLRDAGGFGPWSDYVQERLPWCEWQLVFSAGRLERSVAERVETRDDVRRELRAEGLEVLDDDDRLARLHFRRRKGEEQES